MINGMIMLEDFVKIYFVWIVEINLLICLVLEVSFFVLEDVCKWDNER